MNLRLFADAGSLGAMLHKDDVFLLLCGVVS